MTELVAIIGVDCAVDPRKTGVAVGSWDGSGAVVEAVALPRSEAELVERIVSTIRGSETTLLALDAPLSWPAALGAELAIHQAGASLNATADQAFRRETDRHVKERIGKQPLDVGADRIARTAHQALCLLARVGAELGSQVQLAWEPDGCSAVRAIEVYPAATLTALGVSTARYKTEDESRERVIEERVAHVRFRCETATMAASTDALDAGICVLAGGDFLSGRCRGPFDSALARKEGWIWVREP